MSSLGVAFVKFRCRFCQEWVSNMSSLGVAQSLETAIKKPFQNFCVFCL